MSQTNKTINKVQFYTRVQVIVATIFGGLISGCYLMGRNFNLMNEPKQAKQWYVGGVVATVLLAALFVVLPDRYLHYIPNSLVPLAGMIILNILYIKYQAKYVNQQIQAGAGKQSWWNVLGITIIGLVLTTIAFVIILFLYYV